MMDAQMKAFEACMQTLVESTNTFFKDTTRELTELKASIQFSQIELHAAMCVYFYDRVSETGAIYSI